jgi:hypothetical protein
VSCVGFLSPAQRAALAAASADGPPLSSFASPAHSEGKVRRVRLLAGSSNRTIRESAALSYLAPADVLETLAEDEADSVRACVARNERAPEWVLRALAADPSPQVRGWVAANPSTPVCLRDELATDPDAGVRAVVAWAAGWTPPDHPRRS